MVPPGVRARPSGAGGAAAQQPPALAREDFVQRVLELAGPLADYGRPAILEHYEEIFRVEPNDSWFDPVRSSTNTTTFEIANIAAERGKWIFIFDYSVRPFGFSGLGVGDTAPLEEGNLSGSFGYAMRLGGRPVGIVRYRLDPTSPTLNRIRFKVNESPLKPVSQLTEDDFARNDAAAFASSSGYGGEVHPQAPGRFGAQNVPFMLSVSDDETLEVTGIIFNEITLPVAFIEARLSGYITSAVVGQRLLEQLGKTLR
jgi:hypothetical protein